MNVAWVVPRYGDEVGGGAEELCRRTVDLLRDHVASTVLTTCALDYRTWANHFEAGETRLAGARVIRFEVDERRRQDIFDELSARAYGEPDDVFLGERWMHAQGPQSAALLEHLRACGDDYDCVVFLPYLYATTATGLPVVASRAVLVPCAHDEPPLRLRIFERVFAAARALVFNTPAERRLVESRFGTDGRPRFVAGLAIDPPPTADPNRFRDAYGIRGPYLLCLGRIEPAKGSDVAIERFDEARARWRDLSLVLMGRAHMEIPHVPGLVVTGFVDEQTKHDALAGATVVLLPSAFESLSIAALEAWSHRRPTLANAASEVLVDQTRRANGGLWYANVAEFHEALDVLLSHPPIAEALGLQGRRWVRATANRDRVRRLWLEALAAVASSPVERRAGAPIL
jgi:glycosyltransferase involved in cell wall biosynthesis